jgi:hypothetical protein
MTWIARETAMPTHDELVRFQNEYKRLSPQRKALFRVAMHLMVDDLQAKRPFDRRLRIKGVRKAPGVWEMTWAPDGRATFTYGNSKIPGDAHIIWRRVGNHSILQQP